MQKIPFYIISGFLGSGKTTFLKKIIEKFAPFKRIGVIQNEFAPIGIDSKELLATKKNFNLLEVNNGSVFCVCLLGDFIHSLSEFIGKYNPELLIMEASGLSDTTSISELLTASKLSDKIFLGVNWCIIDAPNFRKTGNIQLRLVHQIRMSDQILINKTDLAGDLIPALKEDIKKINPFASISETTYCDIDPELDVNPVPKYYLNKVEPMARPEINSMVIKSGKKLDLIALKQFLEEWSTMAYRIKGYVNLTDGTTVAVQCIFDQIKTFPADFFLGPTELIALSDQFTLHEWNKSFKEYCTK
jgi:G3E family GTPase